MLTRYFRNITLILLLTFSIGKAHAQETQSDIDFLKQVQSALTTGVVHDAFKMMKDSVGINFYPAFHIADDSALWPYALELYFDVRIERKEPYVLVKLNLNPSTGKWTDFSSYSVSVSLTQGQQKAVPTTVLVAAEKQLNEILANIGNLREYFGKVRDDIAETIQKLRFAMMDKYFEGKNLPLVRFYPSAEQQFGFDRPVQQEIIGKYKNFYRYDSIQRVSWKALSTSKPDKINAYIHVRDTSFKTKKIRFVNRSDVKLKPFTTKGDTLVFQLTGTSKDQDDEITAEYVETDANGKERKAPIGQVKTIAYQEETNIVHIVPVGVKYPATEKELEKFLNKVYNQAVTNWTVVFDDPIKVNDWDLDGDKILNIETGIFQRYSDEEQVFIDALEKAKGSIDPKAAYMFVTDVPNNLNARGYMPLSAQFGFIFLNGVEWDTNNEIELLNTTVAHELGHGIYKLKHPWDEYGTQESQTANLLDYQNGTILWKPQWDWIHDPGVRLYMFQKAAEGAYIEPKLMRLIEDIKSALSKTENTFEFSPAKYDFGVKTTDVRITFSEEQRPRQYKVIRPEYNTQNNWQPNEVNLTFEPKVDFLSGLINNYFLYSLNFYYTDKSFAFAISSIQYANIEKVLKHIGKENGIDQATKNNFIKKLNAYYDQSGHNHDKIDAYYEGIPDFVSQTRPETDLKEDLKSLANGLLDETGTNEEYAILNIISAYGNKSANNLLNDLKESDLFKKIYNNMEDIGGDDNFSAFAMLLYKYWLQSLYSKKEALDAIPYTATKKFGFYFDNYDIESSNNYLTNYLEDDDGNKLEPPYGLFEPIKLLKIDAVNNGLSIPSNTVPFFFFMAYDDKSHSSNVCKGSRLTFDVVTTFTGVGNLAKLRHLKHLTKLNKLKVIIGAVEFTSGTANIILTYTENCGNKQFCEKLSNYLFWIEVGSIGVDAFTSSMIKKSAMEALEVSNSVPNADKRIVDHLADVAQGQEMVGKYDWALVRKYFNYIQEVTERTVPQIQINRLKEALRAKEYRLLSKSDLDAHRLDFNNRKDKIISDWERNTGQKWPTYDEIIYDKNGEIYKRIGDKYDAHHIIENKFGGDNVWWNMHPAKSPSQHQGGIHGATSPSRELFK